MGLDSRSPSLLVLLNPQSLWFPESQQLAKAQEATHQAQEAPFLLENDVQVRQPLAREIAAASAALPLTPIVALMTL